MRWILAGLVAMCLPVMGWTGERAALIRQIVDQEVLPGFAALSRSGARMAGWAELSCEHPDFRYNYVAAFSAWARVSHLRFGPSEEDNLAFALAFWPDPRGQTPKSLRKLLATSDTGLLSPDKFGEMSVAARGFYALDHLLFDDTIQSAGTAEYHCALVQAVTRDIATTAQQLDDRWSAFAPNLTDPAPDGIYRTEDEVLRELFKAASTGLQFSAELRLGRPLGTFDNPRPKQAEAWRSRLSLHLLTEAVRGSGPLALRLSEGDAALSARLDRKLRRFEARAAELDDPMFAGVSAPQSRIRIEALREDLEAIRRIVDQELGPHLGVSAGFNALDGD